MNTEPHAFYRSDEQWVGIHPFSPTAGTRGDSDAENAIIYVSPDQGLWDRIQILLHEALHIAAPYLDEETVDKIAQAQQDALKQAQPLLSYDIRDTSHAP